MRKLRSLQVLRAVAACSVVFLHAYLVASPSRFPRMELGAAGVDLFFVISGFIMASISRGRAPAAFMIDRWWRIYPLWWLATLPELLRDSATLKQVATTLTLWPIWGGSYTFPVPELGWTLAFEMVFYAAMAVGLKTRPALPLALFGLCAVVALWRPVPLLAFIGSPMVLEFLAGVVIARLPRHQLAGALLIILACAYLLSMPVQPFTSAVAEKPHYALLRVLHWGLPAAALVYGCLALEKQFERRIFNLPVLLGDASYSIYVFHMTIFSARPLALDWPLLAVASILGGVLIHLSLERRVPDLRIALRDRWRRGREDLIGAART